MDVSKYSFFCQKALHQGLQYAKSFGHRTLEVEHVALAMLRGGEGLFLKASTQSQLQMQLQKKLNQLPKVFGQMEIKFGLRLDNALDEAEEKAQSNLVEEELLWWALVSHSTALKNLLSSLDSGVIPAASVSDDFKALSESAPEHKSKVDSNNQGTKSIKKVEKDPKTQSPNPENQKLAGEKRDDSLSLSEKASKVLGQFTNDLTALAERGELDPVIGRDNETRRVLEVLGRKKKNNPVLIGEAGVGKTAVAELLALRIAEGRVPESLKGKRILSLDLGAMVAGAKFRGEFEERIKNLLKAVEDCAGQVILFIDEIHMLVGAGKSEGSADAANMLKPALARGELRCLGATTLDEYRTHIEKDPALERRFQAILVEEPTRETALSILRGVKSRYEIHHGVQIHDDALIKAVDFSVRYLTGRRLPDKAIDVMDEACSRLRIQMESMPDFMDKLRAQIDGFQIEKKSIENDKTASTALVTLERKLKATQDEFQKYDAIWRKHQEEREALSRQESKKQELEGLFENAKSKGDFEFAARLQYVEIPKLIEEITELKTHMAKVQEQYSWLRQVVGGIEVAQVVAHWTGIPVNRILSERQKSLLDLERRLKQRIFGQDDALKRVSQAVRRSQVGINDPKRPIGVFLFMGPTGVGKTETVKALAEELFDDENRMLRIDMSEYMEMHSVSRLIGSPPGYVGYGEGGQLSEPVRRNPYTVVLLDEVEKAHKRVLDVLLQIFEDGRLTDGEGRTIDFKNTLIIMTSNLSVELSSKFGPTEADDELRSQLAQVLRPEFVGRIDEVVSFRSLGTLHLEQLLGKLTAELNSRIYERGVRIILGDRLKDDMLHSSHAAQFGGRALRREYQTRVTDFVAEKILVEEAFQGPWILDLDQAGAPTWVAGAGEIIGLRPSAEEDSQS